MTVTQKMTTVYRTSDGREFTDLKEAQKEEFEYQIRKYVDESGMGRGGEWSEDMIANKLIEDYEKLSLIYLEYTKPFLRD